MKKNNKHIEIVRSSTTRLSSMSQESCDAVFAVLSKHYNKVGVTTVNNLSDLENLVAASPDLVFLGMKYVPHGIDKVWVANYLDRHGICYTGSSQAAHELELNKHLAKQQVLEAGLKTPAYHVASRHQPPEQNDISLKYPLFIKPTNRGGGLGIDSDSVAQNFGEYLSKVRSIASDLQSDSLVEEYLPGREFSVAILKDEFSDEFSAMPIELIAEADKHGARMLSGTVKSSNTERVAEVRNESLRSQVCALAFNVFYALGARDYGRVDIRLDKHGTPQFLELNLIPSLIGGYGSFPKACILNIGLEYEPMILRITRLGLARNINDTAGLFGPVTVRNLIFPSVEEVFQPAN